MASLSDPLVAEPKKKHVKRLPSIILGNASLIDRAPHQPPTILPIDASNSKIAFMFLTRGPMPFEDIWHEFFSWRGNQNHYSLYIHAAYPGFMLVLYCITF